MGFEAVKAVLANSATSGSDRLVLMVLASHADDSLICWPGRDLLCRETAMSERNLKYCLRRLEEMGEIETKRGMGRGNLTVYKVVVAQRKGQSTAPFMPADDLDTPAQAEPESSMNAREKGQSAAPYVPQEKGQNPVEKGQNPAQKGQDSSGKGAKTVNAYKEVESSKESSKESPAPIPVRANYSSNPAYFNACVDVIFNHWKKVFNQPEAILDEERKKAIKNALLDMHPVEKLMRAIDGCKASPYYNGGNPEGVVINRISLIFKNSDQIESFVQAAEQATKARTNGNGTGAKRTVVV